MDIDIPKGYQYIDPTKLSIPAKTVIVDDLKNALLLIKNQQEMLYDFSVSPEFKRVYAANNAVVESFNNKVIFRIDHKLNETIEAFKLLGMTGGGWFSFMTKKPPAQVSSSNMEMLLNDLEETISGEKIKFNGILNNMKLYIFTLEKNKERAAMILDTINTKMATFDVILNEMVSLIKKYHKMPSTGGKRQKRRTHRKKRSSKSTRRRL